MNSNKDLTGSPHYFQDNLKCHSIPKRKRGRQSEAAKERYKAELGDFIEMLVQINDEADIRMSSRGWAYILENKGLIVKSELDLVHNLINECRKNGSLPNGFIAQEEARRFHCIEQDIDYQDPEGYAQVIIQSLKYVHENYYPTSIWEDQSYYIQMLVEKVDLRSLYEPICDRYHIPLATSKGWSAIGQRKEMIFRYNEHENEGRIPVLLYCGDHDPAGFHISSTIKSNVDALYGATKWSSDNLIIDRFGLNYDFVVENNLTWIDNLQTSRRRKPNDLANPKHPDHNQEYVQRYLREIGPRKVEANALVTAPVMGRVLCEKAIKKYISEEVVADHEEYIAGQQKEVKRRMADLLKCLEQG